MPGMKIGDARGRGREAKVTTDQRLATDAVSHEGRFRAAVSGNSYVLNTGTTANTLTLTDTGGYIVYMENDSTDKMMSIDLLEISVSAATNIVKVERNASIASPTNTNTYTPVNLNFGSSRAAEGTFYTWNETGDGMTTVTAGTEVLVARLDAALTRWDFAGTLLLDTDDTFTVHAEGVSSTPEIAVNVWFHMIPDTLLEDFDQ